VNKGLRDTPTSRVSNDNYRDEFDRICKNRNQSGGKFIQDPETGDLLECDNYDRTTDSHYVIEDIKPYKSMITGEVISSRSQHRKHLRQHGCEEVGNEKLTRGHTKQAKVKGLRNDIREARAIAQNKSIYNKN
jgi:hypothetical protein